MIKIEALGFNVIDKWLSNSNLDDSYDENINKGMEHHISWGNIITINKVNYILSSYHGVHNSEYIYGYLNDQKMKLSIVTKSEELDIVLLKSSINLGENIIKFKKSLKIPNYRIVFKKEIFTMPSIPYLYIENIDEKASGTLIFNEKNKCIGMVTMMSLIEKKYYAISSIFILKFIEDFKKYDTFPGLKTLLFKSDVCELEDEEIKSDGLVIKNLNKITYANKGFILKENDIIYKINNKLIIGRKIFDEKIGLELPYDTYISLFTKVTIDYYRYCTEKKDYILYSYKPLIKPINLYRNIQITSSVDDYYIYNGIIFCELTCDIINLYKKNNIQIEGYALENYIHNQYTNFPTPTIIILDIIECFAYKYSEDLPYKKLDNNNYNIAVIKNINNSKVKNITSLKSLLPCKNNNINYTFDGINIKTIAFNE